MGFKRGWEEEMMGKREEKRMKGEKMEVGGDGRRRISEEEKKK